ncbi:MAG: sugar ABC transporter substrate-binding protein [Geobacteraceae bacterium]|nr:sugar ABC transporter substrate-binding protein [Geobacteraceae bacterium]NTW79774.1 sugar ABC transporter substrate-binding protein [Geobacteraceae bacterium]
MHLKYLLLALVLLVLVPLSTFAGDYIIGEGDGLDIAVWGVKELTFSVKVRPDGKITVPGLGDVSVSGQTPANLQSSLFGKLKELVKNPIVTVTVRDITNSKVYVFGGGVKAGVYDLSRRTTLLQLLCTVGELKTADLKKSYLKRNGKKIKEDFYKLFISGEGEDDPMLESGDSLFIPLLTDKSVYVLGAVNMPKTIEYRDGLTVMEAILESGGFTKFASQNDTQIIRNEAGAEVSIPVRAKDLIKDGKLGLNIKLKPGDYIIVKESLF